MTMKDVYIEKILTSERFHYGEIREKWKKRISNILSTTKMVKELSHCASSLHKWIDM